MVCFQTALPYSGFGWYIWMQPSKSGAFSSCWGASTNRASRVNMITGLWPPHSECWTNLRPCRSSTRWWTCQATITSTWTSLRSSLPSCLTSCRPKSSRSQKPDQVIKPPSYNQQQQTKRALLPRLMTWHQFLYCLNTSALQLPVISFDRR